ncbi:tocopherol cyclase family protein [Maribellus sp. YY47]|uniref:tocopherol cyclase family protein n=1 Tax=Maribellus sp. YY47 TaxID=2929486 RepID=UPI0020010F82|nr:tocopherol cyclase family protein [Maribellus sp. YY47]MCK3685325.1 tocopherol cyclase family protein [Maribellus sp. YY47]
MRWIKQIQALFHPERYHGWVRSNKYFEGWYYKIVSANEQHAFAFIPGIARREPGEQHAFLQVLDGKAQTAEYIKFPGSAFSAASASFRIEIDRNQFTGDFMHLDHDKYSGTLQFKNKVPWPGRWYSPGIMGPYTFVPFMECYHGIVSMDHELKGTLRIGDKNIDFSGGRGYIEKDWGHSFPSAYFWMQSNHFSGPGISFKASVAKIPWLRSSFVGFIAGFYFNGKLLEFTTYNGTKLLHSLADSQKVELLMENKHYRLKVMAHRDRAAELASPIAGFMEGRISESMTSELVITLSDKSNGNILFHDTGRNAALEVAGKIEEIIFDDSIFSKSHDSFS